MGLSLSKVFSRSSKKTEIQIVMIGLSGSGKTTILNQMKQKRFIWTAPTVGFNVEKIKSKDVEFEVWDISDRCKILPFWNHYVKKADGVIYVVDSTNRLQINAAAEQLQDIMKCNDLKKTILLVFANKQDMQNAMSSTEIAQKLHLQNLKQTWHVQATCAIDGTDINEGLNFLADIFG